MVSNAIDRNVNMHVIRLQLQRHCYMDTLD